MEEVENLSCYVLMNVANFEWASGPEERKKKQLSFWLPAHGGRSINKMGSSSSSSSNSIGCSEETSKVATGGRQCKSISPPLVPFVSTTTKQTFSLTPLPAGSSANQWGNYATRCRTPNGNYRLLLVSLGHLEIFSSPLEIPIINVGY